MVGMCIKWAFWDASGWVFYIDIFNSGNLEGFSPEGEVSAYREERSCLSDSCCEGSVIPEKTLKNLTKKICSFHLLPHHGFIAAVPPSFPLFSPAQVLLMFLMGCFSHQYSLLVLSGLFLSSFRLSSLQEYTLVKFSSWTQQLQTDFYMFFSCWAVESRTVFPLQFSPWQYCLPVIDLKTPEFGLTRKPWYGSVSSQFCLWCFLPTGFWHPVTPDAELQKNSFLHWRILVLNSTEDTFSLVQQRDWP